jgi:transglutaminase-like putative cysteine protease
VEGVDAGWDQVEAITASFQNEGFYAETDIPPGHSYARITRFLEQLSVPVGYAEQYAAGAAVLARALNIPARVVVGFRIPDGPLARRDR